MSAEVLAALNDYAGDNIWDDVILRLDYDEDATNAVEHGSGEDVVIGGVHYRCKAGEWSEVGPAPITYSSLLRAATQTGGRPDGWPHDVYSLVLWAAIGCGEWPSEAPDTEIAELRQAAGDPAVELQARAFILMDQPVEIVLAAAWAGLARHALAERDQCIRAAPERVSARQIGSRVGLSHVAVGTIRSRIED